ncbi:MAG TPA: molybdate ABC transporter substrate-binding protein [Noviherbaspirillum sp.]|nr:molybdate ABC transporter substrate-binding protein [Noviherbaspirillum sp.]
MKRLLAALLFCVSGAAVADVLTVAVAANVQYAFSAIAEAFQKESNHRIRPIYNSSGKLTAQITHGAPFDVFLSADMEYPQALHRSGHAPQAPRVYASGALVLWTMHPALDLQDWRNALVSSQVRRIAIANPKLAPYGREAMKAFAHFGLADAITPKLVYGESVSQVNQYTHSRAVDAGITAKSVVMAPEMQGQGRWVELPQDSYVPIEQGIVVLAYGRRNNPVAAQQFHDFVLSPAGRAILSRYGYLLP